MPSEGSLLLGPKVVPQLDRAVHVGDQDVATVRREPGVAYGGVGLLDQRLEAVPGGDVHKRHSPSVLAVRRMQLSWWNSKEDTGSKWHLTLRMDRPERTSQ